MSERWKTIPGFDSYEVSDCGRVRCAVRTYKRGAGSILKQQIGPDGYHRIGLWRDGERSDRLVHRLVLDTFVGPPPTRRHQGAHWDNDRSNNRLGNLRWATPRENKADSYRHGTVVRGEMQGGARLTEEIVKALRIRCREGELYSEMARELKVSPSTVALACRGLTWGHVQ